MIRTTTEKTCVLCGENCSRKPRVKDDRGRYYCKTCHQAALARQAKAAQPSHGTVRQSAPAGAMEEDEVAIDDPPERRESASAPPAPDAFIDDDDDDIQLMDDDDD